MLIFNSWLKDIERCIKKHKLLDTEAVQLIKDYTVENARQVIEFYLNTNTKWSNHALTEHLQTSFKSGVTFNSLVGDLYGQC